MLEIARLEMIGRKEFDIIRYGSRSDKQELYNQLRRTYRMKYNDLEATLSVRPKEDQIPKDKGDLLELWTCACFGGVLYKDIDQMIKIELGLSSIDKGVDIIDFENKLLIQCKNYESRLSYKDISTFEFYSNVMKQDKIFKKFRKVLVVGGNGSIDELIRKKEDIRISRVDIGHEYREARLNGCCVKKISHRSNALCRL